MSRNHGWHGSNEKLDKRFAKNIKKLLEIEERNNAKRSVVLTCDISNQVRNIFSDSLDSYDDIMKKLK